LEISGGGRRAEVSSLLFRAPSFFGVDLRLKFVVPAVQHPADLVAGFREGGGALWRHDCQALREFNTRLQLP
jgi:hypothetical protein